MSTVPKSIITALAVMPEIPFAAIVLARDVIEKTTGLVLAEAESTVITVTSVEQYRALDAYLNRIRFARIVVEEKLSTPIVQPVYRFLESLYAIRRELDGPLETLEARVKRKMSDWQNQEDARVKREQAERDRVEAEDRARIQKELTAADAKRLEDLEDQVLVSNDPLETSRLLEKAEEIKTSPAPVISFASVPIAGLTRAANSSAKPKQKWKIVDIELFIEGVYAGAIPRDALMIDPVAVNRHFKLDQKGVAAWPGMEVYTDVEIAGR